MGGSFFIVDALVGHIGIMGRRHRFIRILMIEVRLLWLVLQGIVLEGDSRGLD